MSFPKGKNVNDIVSQHFNLKLIASNKMIILYHVKLQISVCICVCARMRLWVKTLQIKTLFK